MTDAYCETQLIEKFKGLEGLTVTEDGRYPEVAFPNMNFERPDDGYWYELYFLPGQPVQVELGTEGRNRWVGVLRVNVCTPKNSGIESANDRYELIAKHFRSGLYINGVRIIRTSRSSAIEDGDYYVLPVDISFWADLDR